VAGLHTQTGLHTKTNHQTTQHQRQTLGTTYTWEKHCQNLPPYNYRIKVHSASTMNCYTPWGWIFCIRNMSEEWQRSVLCFNWHFNCIFKWKHYGVLVKTLWCFSEWCVETRTVCIDFIKNKCASRSVSVKEMIMFTSDFLLSKIGYSFCHYGSIEKQAELWWHNQKH
jgi:hypothetical protein